MTIKQKTILPLFFLCLLASCQSSIPLAGNSDTSISQGTTKTSATVELSQVISHYAENIYLNYQDTYTTAQTLQKSVEKLVAEPSQANLENAKTAWLNARKFYALGEGFRFYQGPIDSESGPEPWLNSWPLDEGFIDSIEGEPLSGIINNPQKYPEISNALLRELNQKGGDKNISTGYHAIEFLLWGQDLSEGPGAGQRSFTDYVPAQNAQATRRGQYLLAVTNMVVEDFQKLVQAWQPNQSDNYRTQFLQSAPDQALAKILRGIGTLSASELASERLGTPLDIGEREEEHSCFSDNTDEDIRYNVQSIVNILTGSYTRSNGSQNDGPGILALLSAASEQESQNLQTSIAQAKALAAEIQAPFDQELRPDNKAGNQRILALIQELKHLGGLIVQTGKTLGVTVNTDL
jgi:putative iron-regulated protein